MWFTDEVDWPLLAPLSPEDQARVIAAARPRHYARGEVLFHEDDPGDCMHLIRSGRVAIRVSTPTGETLTLAVLRPGDAFGELAAMGREHRRTATAVAWEPVESLTVSGADFEALCREHPSIEKLVISLLTERVDRLSQRLLEALYVGVDRRVYRRLVDLCDIYGDDGPTTIIPVTQDDLAGLVGASRPTINQVLQRLDEQGLVRVGRGRIEVLDAEALERRALR